MKPASENPVADTPFDADRGDVQAAIDEAKRAADPDYYMQQATGRTLTKLVAVVGALQVGGVLIWLVMFFGGFVDATQNLDSFMIGQLVVFLTSIAVGLGLVVRHLRKLRADTEAMEPGLRWRLVELVDPTVEFVDEPKDDEERRIIETVCGRAPEQYATGRIGETMYRLADVDGLVLTAEFEDVGDTTTLIYPRDEKLPEGIDELGGDPEKLQAVPFDEPSGFEELVVVSSDPDRADALVNPRVRAALVTLYETATERDRLDAATEGGMTFVVAFRDSTLRVVRCSEVALSPDDQAVDDATVDAMMRSVCELRGVRDVVAAIDGRAAA